MATVRFKIPKTPEKVIVKATVKNTILANYVNPFSYNKGDTVSIARIIRTPIGLQFRIFGTTHWIKHEDLDVVVEPNMIYDYTGKNENELIPESWPKGSWNRTTEQNAAQNISVDKILQSVKRKKKNSSTIQQNNFKNRFGYVINNHNPIAGKLNKIGIGVNGMDKRMLRNVLNGLNAYDVIKITFLGAKESQTGEYSVLRIKKGRGKGGSLLAELKSATSGDILVTGSPDSDSILHIVTPNGTLHGHETPEDVPPVFQINFEMFTTLRGMFKSLVEKCDLLPRESPKDTRSRFAPKNSIKVDITSTYEPINGSFSMISLELKRGRFGKIVMNVRDKNGAMITVDAYQHSGVITSFDYTEFT